MTKENDSTAEKSTFEEPIVDKVDFTNPEDERITYGDTIPPQPSYLPASETQQNASTQGGQQSASGAYTAIQTPKENGFKAWFDQAPYGIFAIALLILNVFVVNTPGLGILLSIGSIILAILSLKKGEHKVWGIAALIVASLGLLIAIGLIFFLGLLFAITI